LYWPGVQNACTGLLLTARGFNSRTKLPKEAILVCFLGYKWLQRNLVKSSFYPLRNCWRVRIPASESETGKRFAKYLETREAAEHFIAEHRKTGSIQLAKLSVEEKHVLGLIRKSEFYKPELLLDVWHGILQSTDIGRARLQNYRRRTLALEPICQGTR
jgi:hypothetical protein